MTETRIRVLVAKPGLDGHDRGAKVVARALRDGGMEVIYTGLHQTPEMIVNAAIQEDADVVGISVMSGAHNHLIPEICRLLSEKGAKDIPVVLGGIIPQTDFAAMEEAGVKAIYTPGTSLAELVEGVKNLGEQKRQAEI